jgi:hypothetical protein
MNQDLIIRLARDYQREVLAEARQRQRHPRQRPAPRPPRTISLRLSLAQQTRSMGAALTVHFRR